MIDPFVDNDLEDLKRRLINLQKDVTTLVCWVMQIREVAREIPVHPTKDEYPECPICLADVDKSDMEAGHCQNCGQKLDWSKE